MNERFLGMFIAVPGMGKTRILGSAAIEPRLGNKLMLDFEGNCASIRSRITPCTMGQLADQKWVPAKDKINHLRITTIEESKRAYDILNETNDFDDPNCFQTVMIDSFGELAYKHLQKITQDNFKATGKGKGIAPLIGDYGDSSAIMGAEIRRFRDLNMHLILTCHAKVDRDSNTGMLDVSPQLAGQLKTSVPGMLQFVGYIRGASDQSRRELLCQPVDNLLCLKNLYEDSTFPATMEYGVNDPILTMVLDGLGFEPLSVHRFYAPPLVETSGKKEKNGTKE